MFRLSEELSNCPEYFPFPFLYYEICFGLQYWQILRVAFILQQAASQQAQVQSNSGLMSSQPNSVPNMYNQQQAVALNAQYGNLGGFPTASAPGYYGTPQPTGGAPQYAYSNYGACQQPSANDSHQ